MTPNLWLLGEIMEWLARGQFQFITGRDFSSILTLHDATKLSFLFPKARGLQQFYPSPLAILSSFPSPLDILSSYYHRFHYDQDMMSGMRKRGIRGTVHDKLPKTPYPKLIKYLKSSIVQ